MIFRPFLIRRPDSFRSLHHSTPLLLLFLLLVFCSHGVIADAWQPSEARSWVKVDTPVGWSVSVDANETAKPDDVTLKAVSPDTNSRLTYILARTPEPLTINEIQQFQSSYMSKLGFRICKTKDPIKDENADHTAYRQTYVRGIDDAAVIGTVTYPGWGIGHYILVLQGTDAVAKYYESIPPQVAEHIRPVTNAESTESVTAQTS
nr:hypothetical protein [uncultured Methanospirillum sp.]